MSESIGILELHTPLGNESVPVSVPGVNGNETKRSLLSAIANSTTNITSATNSNLTGLLTANGTKVSNTTGITFGAGSITLDTITATGNGTLGNATITGNLVANLTIVANASTTYTFSATDNSRVLRLGNASAITVTLPNSLFVGFNVTVFQTGAGNITFSNATGANLFNRSGHTKAAGQWAMVTLVVDSNGNGANANYVLGGDTQT